MANQDALRLIHTILTDEVKQTICAGIDNGVELFQKRDRSNRSDLGEYASNARSRDFFSCLCKCISDAVNESQIEHFSAECKNAKNSHYVEIKGDQFLMHLHKAGSKEWPEYIKKSIRNNKSFNNGDSVYFLIIYKVRSDNSLQSIAFNVVNPKGSAIYQETINGIWQQRKIIVKAGD